MSPRGRRPRAPRGVHTVVAVTLLLVAVVGGGAATAGMSPGLGGGDGDDSRAGMAAPTDHPTDPPSDAQDLVPITIVATNDVHGRLYPPGTPEGHGGAMYLAAHIDQVTDPDAIHVDAGDLTGSTARESWTFFDEPTVDVMNEIGLDIHAAGNHEFDRGADELLRLRTGGCLEGDCGYRDGVEYEGADFTTLAANIRDADTGELLFEPSTTREVDGVTVGFVGATATAEITDYGRQGLDIDPNWLGALNHAARDVADAGADIVVAVRHQGWHGTSDESWEAKYNACLGLEEETAEAAAEFDDVIDVVVDGHTHNAYVCDVTDGPLVTQAFRHGVMFTEISLQVDAATGEVAQREATNHLVTHDDGMEPDLGVMAVLERYARWWEEREDPAPDPTDDPTHDPTEEPTDPETTPAPPAGSVEEEPTRLRRVAGGDRIETAAMLARRFERADTVLLARADHFADALVAGPLASQYQAPLLLTHRDGLAPAAAAELSRLSPARVVLVGGTAALGHQVQADVQALPSVPADGVRRIAGGDRYATATAIADEIAHDGTREAFLTTGTNFPDALAGAALAAHLHAPVLLTDPRLLPDTTADYLRSDALTAVHVLGGTTAVSDQVEALAAEAAGAPTARIAGGDRYDTAAQVAARFPSFSTAFVATGQNFPDALAGVAAAADRDAPVVLVERDRLPPTSALQVRRVEEAAPPRTIVVVGGEAAIAPTVVDRLDPN